MSEFDIIFRLEENDWSSSKEKFFVGAWHPSATLNVKVMGGAVKNISGDNWFILSSCANDSAEKTGPLHGERNQYGEYSKAILFSGYLLEPSLHTFSTSDKVFNYFNGSQASDYNGVFSLVKIEESGGKIEIRSDAFGISPLYFRIHESMILFSSNPRFLRMENDSPDLLAWRGLIQSRALSSDRTLSAEIRRFPCGSIMVNQGHNLHTLSWFNLSELPAGEKVLDRTAVADLEDSFRCAVNKCLKLQNGCNFLPLSSGYDSRRLVAHFNDLKVDFESATVRVFQRGYRDLDARYSAQMARDFGFRHKVIDLPQIEEYIQNDLRRRVLLDAETSLHTWYVSLIEGLPEGNTVVFDGLGGDVWGETGYEISDFFKGIHSKRTQKIADHIIDDSFESVFSINMPSASDVRADIRRYLEVLPESIHLADFAFLLMRTRRAISLGVQQLLPLGHLVVFPYIDLDYIKTSLNYSPFDKIEKSIQARCLERFWPQYYSYRGSRNYPKDLPSEGERIYFEQLSGRFGRMKMEINNQKGMVKFKSLLSKKARIIFRSSCCSKKALFSREWYFMGLMELVARQSRNDFFLEIATAPAE
ncbi:MAG: hypothetical protein P1P84_12385 [Deferrisomatales bacterium]|nr:hypothetical protein [Deferrisomatales bacterium]